MELSKQTGHHRRRKTDSVPMEQLGMDPRRTMEYVPLGLPVRKKFRILRFPTDDESDF
jgi:hypothetical protein